MRVMTCGYGRAPPRWPTRSIAPGETPATWTTSNCHRTSSATNDAAEALAGVTTVLLAVPSQTLRENLEKWAPLVTPGATLVSLAKGIELGTLMRMSQVIIQVTGVDPSQVAVLSGPNLASEIAVEQPAATVIACTDSGRAVARATRIEHRVLPALHQRRRDRHRDRRRVQERHRAGMRDGGRRRTGGEHRRGHHHPRPGRDHAPGHRRRRQGRHAGWSGRSRRPGGDMRVHPGRETGRSANGSVGATRWRPRSAPAAATSRRA